MDKIFSALELIKGPYSRKPDFIYVVLEDLFPPDKTLKVSVVTEVLRNLSLSWDRNLPGPGFRIQKGHYPEKRDPDKTKQNENKQIHDQREDQQHS